MSRAVMQQALEALEWGSGTYDRRNAAITALKQALAEPEQEQEPFILQTDAIGMRRPELRESHQITLTAGTAIYIAPTPRKPQTTHWEGCEAVHPECRKPEQQPVAHSVVEPLRPDEYQCRVSVKWVGQPVSGPLYTAPTPQPDTDCHAQGICQRSGYSIANTPRKPVELTDSEVDDLTMAIRNAYPLIVTPLYVWCRHFSRAVIDAYERNNGITGGSDE